MTAKTTIRGLIDLRRPFARIAAMASAVVLAACQPLETAGTGGSTGQTIDPSQPLSLIHI